MIYIPHFTPEAKAQFIAALRIAAMSDLEIACYAAIYAGEQEAQRLQDIEDDCDIPF